MSIWVVNLQIALCCKVMQIADLSCNRDWKQEGYDDRTQFMDQLSEVEITEKVTKVKLQRNWERFPLN